MLSASTSSVWRFFPACFNRRQIFLHLQPPLQTDSRQHSANLLAWVTTTRSSTLPALRVVVRTVQVIAKTLLLGAAIRPWSPDRSIKQVGLLIHCSHWGSWSLLIVELGLMDGGRKPSAPRSCPDEWRFSDDRQKNSRPYRRPLLQNDNGTGAQRRRASMNAS